MRNAFVLYLQSSLLALFVLVLQSYIVCAEPTHQDSSLYEQMQKNKTEIPKAELEDVNTSVKKMMTSVKNLYTNLVEKKQLAAPWRKKWEESQKHIQTLQKQAKELAEDFQSKKELILYVGTAERNLSHLLPSLNRYKKWAMLMEAAMSRLYLIKRDTERELHPLLSNLEQTEKLLTQVRSLSSYTVSTKRDNEEYRTYQKNIQETQKLLEQSIAQKKADLEPARHLLEQIEKTYTEIQQQLPESWKNYYLQKPIPWLDANAWTYAPKQIELIFSVMQMRKIVDVPGNTNDWRKLGLRGLISLLLFTVALVVLRRQSWIATDTNETVNHIFKISLPLICFGLSLLISSISPSSDSYRFFMALGNIFIILGQIYLAWDLRLLSAPNIANIQAPLLRLFPLTFVAYMLLYLPLLPSILLILWLVCVAAVLIWRRFWSELEIGSLRLEKNIRTFDGLILWICLILALSGLPLLSVIAYLCSVSICLAWELCLGGIDRFNYLNENQPSEGLTAVLSNLAVSLAAPIIMMIAVTSVLLWVATLPGGMILMKEYLLKNVSIGSAEFNFLHILLIISAFFLTKAIVASGSKYLSKLISNRKNTIDATLVTPAQTAYTYTIWIFFAFFVMHILDIDLKNAAMVMTGLSVGIGMGLQNIVNNFFSGLLLIFGRMLQVGDVIEVKGITGTVSRISVRDTLIRTYDNAYIYVPNSEFISGHLVNWSRNDATVRASVSVGVAYGSDTDKVIRILQTIVDKHESILRYPQPSVALQQFGDNSLDFSVFFWVNKFDDKVKTCAQVRLQIEKEFTKNNIEIAFPQLDVHVKGQVAQKKQPLHTLRPRTVPKNTANHMLRLRKTKKA